MTESLPTEGFQRKKGETLSKSDLSKANLRLPIRQRRRHNVVFSIQQDYARLLDGIEALKRTNLQYRMAADSANFRKQNLAKDMEEPLEHGMGDTIHENLLHNDSEMVVEGCQGEGPDRVVMRAQYTNI